MSKRVTGVVTDDSVAKKDVVNDYLSGWTPSDYVADESTVIFEKHHILLIMEISMHHIQDILLL